MKRDPEIQNERENPSLAAEQLQPGCASHRKTFAY
jgi:hypothetical protein